MNRRQNPAAEHLRSRAPDYADDDRKKAIAASEAVATKRARQWLEDRHIVAQNVTGPERRAKLRAYIARLKTLPKPEPRSWAYDILSRIADGEQLPPICQAMAEEVVAMGKTSEDLQEAA